MRSNRISGTIEFLGGPFDGHVATFSGTAEQLPEDVLAPVSENMFRVLDGHVPEQGLPVTSLVIYERQSRAARWYYVLVGAVAPAQVQFRDAGTQSGFEPPPDDDVW